MYIVTIENGNQSIEIHGESEKLKSGNVIKGINVIDSFSFTLLPSNIGFNLINDYKTLVWVYNTNKNRVEFDGRVLYSNAVMEESGLIYKEVTCESYFGFLCDSKQHYVAEKNWTVDGLLKHIIDEHNSQVEGYKQFAIGYVTVTDPNNNLYVGIQRENTWKTIEDKLIGKVGGEIRFRVEDGITYIDYLAKIGEYKSTTIELSKNMKAITRECDPSNFISRLIPLGCKLKDANGNETEERLDITSVNGGLDYIEDEDAKNAYGIRVDTVEFDGVTDASNLLTKGRAFLAENNRAKVKYSIKSLDLSLLGLDIDDFEVHNYYPIKNGLLAVDDVARVIKKNIDVCNELDSTIEVGDNFKTLSEIQRDQYFDVLNKVDKLPSKTWVESAASNATNWINGVNGGYVVVHKNSDGIPYEILVMDEKNIDEAVNVWRFNKNGLGCSTTGYEGPYTLAMTIDGSFVADFITAGTLKGVTIIGEKGMIGGFSLLDKELVVELDNVYISPGVEEAEKINKYVVGSATLNDLEKVALDVNGDGNISVSDASLILAIARGDRKYSDCANAKPGSVKVRIDPKDPTKLICISGTTGWGKTFEHYFGVNGFSGNSVNAGNVYASEIRTAAGIDLDELAARVAVLEGK